MGQVLPQFYKETYLWDPPGFARLGDADTKVAPRKLSAVSSIPGVTSLNVEGYSVSDYDDLDRAGAWIDCRQGPTCPHRAFLTTIYPDVGSAMEAIERRGRDLADTLFPHRPGKLTRKDPLRFRLWHIATEDVVGRDYRKQGCALPDAARQLREGAGNEAAWNEIKRQRATEGVEGALLSGPSLLGELFLFVECAHRLIRQDLIQTVSWRDDRA